MAGSREKNGVKLLDYAFDPAGGDVDSIALREYGHPNPSVDSLLRAYGAGVPEGVFNANVRVLELPPHFNIILQAHRDGDRAVGDDQLKDALREALKGTPEDKEIFASQVLEDHRQGRIVVAIDTRYADIEAYFEKFPDYVRQSKALVEELTAGNEDYAALHKQMTDFVENLKRSNPGASSDLVSARFAHEFFLGRHPQAGFMPEDTRSFLVYGEAHMAGRGLDIGVLDDALEQAGLKLFDMAAFPSASAYANYMGRYRDPDFSLANFCKTYDALDVIYIEDTDKVMVFDPALAERLKAYGIDNVTVLEPDDDPSCRQSPAFQQVFKPL